MHRTTFGSIVVGLAMCSAATFCPPIVAAEQKQPNWASETACESPQPASPDAPLVGDQPNLAKLAEQAVSVNAETAQSAIAELRSAGPAGLEALMTAYRATIDQHTKEGATRSAEPQWQRLMSALDDVGGQHNCQSSGLYWYTDFDAAKAAAKQSGKPILSLRLLGKLTDEFSCANSRFFRSTLYTNEDIRRELREHFVLHWQSVRPVPKVTIDFGDGRKLERTLTGNSIHYILDSDGQVIDALPGLYGPQAFLRGLRQTEQLLAATATLDAKQNEAQRNEALRAFHAAQSKQILTAWQTDMRQLGLTVDTAAQAMSAQGIIPSQPMAVAANRVSRSKGQVETNVLAAALPDPAVLSSETDDGVWARIAQLHAADAQLDPASIAFIQAQNPAAGRAMPLAASKAKVESSMLRLVHNLQNTISIDTVRNEYTFHQQIHDWFASGQVPLDIDVNQLNDRVYAQLFLTPSSDPWLGLLPGDVYTALDDAGVKQ
jgi:hypothetical protein